MTEEVLERVRYKGEENKTLQKRNSKRYLSYKKIPKFRGGKGLESSVDAEMCSRYIWVGT